MGRRTAKAMEGKNGFLFLYNDRNDVIRQISGAINLAQEESLRWRDVINTRQAACARLGAQYLYLIVPNKHCVYPQYLNESVVVSEKRIARDMERAVRHVLYPCDMLRACDGLVYHKTDTHWTSVGCAHVWNHIAEMLELGFKHDTANVQKVPIIGDLGSKMSPQQESVSDELEYMPTARKVWDNQLHNRGKIVIYKNDESDLKRAIIFGDSFTYGHMEHVAAYFSECYFINTNLFSLPLIQQLSPDVVITQTAERFLDNSVPAAEDLFVHLLNRMESGKYKLPNLKAFLGLNFNPLYPEAIHAEMLSLAQRQVDFLESVGADRILTFVDDCKRSKRLDVMASHANSSKLACLHHESFLYHEQKGELAKAFHAISHAVAMSDYNHKYRFAFSRLLAHVGHLDESITQARAAVSLKEDDAHYRWHLATLLIQSKQIDKAQKEIGTLRGYIPKIRIPHLLLSSLYFDHGYVDLSIAEARRAIEYNRKDYAAHCLLAKLYLGQQRFDLAKQFALLAIKLNPKSQEAHDLLKKAVAYGVKRSEVTAAVG